jgi:hypothetical protein
MSLSFPYLALLHVLRDYLLLETRGFDTCAMTYTRTRRSSTFSSVSDCSGRVSSPSIEPEAWLPQRSAYTLTPTPLVPAFDKTPTPSAIPITTRSVESLDLFVTLLHDRGSAYLHSPKRATPYLTPPSLDDRRSLACSLNSSWTENSPSRRFSHVRTTEQERYLVKSPSIGRESTDRSMVVKAPRVSKRRAGCSTKNATKSKGKSDASSQRKRSAAALEVGDSQKRASKAAKIEAKANIGVKVDASTTSLPEITELSSDSETGEELEKPGTNKKARPKTMLLHLKLHQPHRPPANSPATDRTPLWGIPKADSPNSITDLKPDLKHVVHETDTKAGEIQGLRRDLQAATERVHRLEQELEKEKANTSLERRKLQIKHNQEESRFTQGLEDEKARSRRLDEQVQDSSVNNTKLKSELRALRNQYDQERQDRKEEQRRHAEVLDDIFKPKAGEKNLTDEIKQVKKDNARLSAENINLKANAVSSQNCTILSPVPSSISSADDDRKEDNIRRIYIKTKRQYDVLLAATKNLLTCTRSMDLSCFGEFGSYMAKLRKVLEGEASSRSDRAQIVFKEDDDISFGSQSSRL